MHFTFPLGKFAFSIFLALILIFAIYRCFKINFLRYFVESSDILSSHNLANSHLIITAIHNATGVWVDPPATPDRVLKALGKCEIGGLE